MSSTIFYNENSYCNSCMKCVSSCKLKAIKFIDNLPKIVEEYCVNCGECYNHCSPHAIEFIDSIQYAKELIRNNNIVVASLSPTWVSEFRGVTKSGMIRMLKMLGFNYVSETTHGASQMLDGVISHLKGGAPLTISSACPAISSMVVKYYPHLAQYLAPVEMPVIAHAKSLRKVYGDNIKVVSLSSCVAEKTNYDRDPQDVNSTVTFKELKKWFDEMKIDYKSSLINDGEELSFEPFDASGNHDYIFASGSILNALGEAGLDLTFISFSGMENGVNTLDVMNVDKLEKQTFVNLLACKDGCFSTSGSIKMGDNIHKLITYKDHYKSRTTLGDNEMPSVDITRDYKVEDIENIHDIDPVKINGVLESIYTSPTGKQIDCGKCGYPTCRDFARGVVRGMAQKFNCAPHYQKVLRDNFSIMVEHIPYSTFVVDVSLNIIESNELFQEEIGLPMSSNGMLSKNDIEKYIPFCDDIRKMFEERTISYETDVIVRGKMQRVTLFPMREYKFVCGIVRNMVSGGAMGGEMVLKTRKIISDNIEAVHQIAILLGENASRTEALLNSILETNYKEQ